MADIILNKVINGELHLDLLFKWLQNDLQKVEEISKQINVESVTQIDFITYFINFVHEETARENKRFNESDQNLKLNTPKKIKHFNERNPQSFIKGNLFPDKQHTSIVQSNNSTPNTNSEIVLNKNDSYFSPVSPLYQNANLNLYHTPAGPRKSIDKHSVCLGDFLVGNLKSSKKKKVSLEFTEIRKEASRRIKPTNVIKNLNSGFENTGNSFNFENNDVEVSINSADQQRNILIEEKEKIVSNTKIPNKNRPVLLKRQSSTNSDIKLDLVHITFKKEIEYVIEIYKFVLDNEFVLNMTSEVYFLISLLLTKQKDIVHEAEDINLGIQFLDLEENSVILEPQIYNAQMFESIHNIVYFAIKCLETQIKVIKLYDKATIELLASNERIQIISESFSKTLLLLAKNKTEQSDNDILTTPVSQSNVCFNIDTDNRNNFPIEKSFHAFRKQRDLFYDILKIWENNHLLRHWNCASDLGGKIRTLFSLSSDPINYIHLARLFKNQLLTSCGKGTQERGLSENVTVPSSLTIDTDKFNRLTNRLITKQSSNGINSLPTFSGYQEFYKDFIVIANNHFFNKHLCDILVNDIVELNESKFWETDLENDKDADVETRKIYFTNIRKLRILAKFLGFIESIPYKLNYQPSERVIETQLQMRNQCAPLLDIKTILNTAILRKSLVLVLPWLTKYLAMLDYITLRLPYYISVHQILFDIYSNSSITGKCNLNVAVIKFSLGWLFELPHFPESEYFNFCSRAIAGRGAIEAEKPMLTNGLKNEATIKCLDNLNVINPRVLYVCCPYLEEIKKLLSTSCSSRNVSVKYITPVTAVESDVDKFNKKLEAQLEEAFFSGHPSSLKKTVEFVSERVSSAAVKYICNLTPDIKTQVLKNYKEKVLKKPSRRDGSKEEEDVVKKKLVEFAQQYVSVIITKCADQLAAIGEKQIPESINGLLPLDAHKEMKEVSIRCATKMYMKRVKNWLASHSAVLSKDLGNEFYKLMDGKTEKEKTSSLPPLGRASLHNEKALCGWHVLNNLREICCEIVEQESISEEDVIKLIKETYRSLISRNDLNDAIVSIIHGTLFDMCLLLVSNHPCIFNKTNVLKMLIMVWKLQKPNGAIKNLFCSKNLKLLQHSKAWDFYAKIIAELVENKIIEENDFEFECTSFYNRDWDKETLTNFSNFLKQFLTYSTCDKAESKFAMLLEFLSDFCIDL